MFVTYCLACWTALRFEHLSRTKQLFYVVCFALIGALTLGVTNTCAQDSQFNEDEQKQIAVAARFLGVLEKSPRRGTALERIYGHHVEFGTLDKFLQELKSDLEKSPENGSKWMLLGLFESQRGEDAAAIDAFKKAEELRATDPLPAYYASQSMIRLGDTDGAVAAMERAISRKPQRADLMEVYQNLGRVYQRAQRTEKALEVWKRFESEFPNDVRVLEQIARILSEENQLDQALVRYEKLSKLVKDDYQRTNFRIAAAELKIRNKQREQGLSDFESILSDLNPESWLHKDIRRRIEEVFLRTNDQDSLVAYYQAWLTKNPEDVDAMARLSKFLSLSARVPEATQWIEKALKLAPSRSELRKAFIDQLVEQQRYDEASEQYRKLAEANPGNTDFLRDWGRLVLRNKEMSQQDRNAKATTIWNRMLTGKDKDALLHAQVADLFRNAGMNDRAMELYQKAVEIEPGSTQYREYLGEFYHIQNRKDDALATWTAIAAGKQRTAENVTRLAEIFQSFGYYDKSTAEIQAACQMQPKDFALNLQAAEYHNRAGKYDEALKFVDIAQSLAENDDQREAGYKAKIEILQASQRLEEVTTALASELANKPKATESEWFWLARCEEARREWAEAMASIDKALAIHPDWIPALTAGARIQESSGDFGRAAEFSRRLAQADKRSRDEHLMSVARLEMQLGRMNEAINAGEDLILASPSNTDNYLFIAQIYERFGKDKEALDALRKAVRINPDDPALMMTLARSLGEKLQTREAIELYWRAFEKSDTVDDQTSLTTRLVQLYEQINQVDQIIERFQRERQDVDKRRAYTICLAQAYQTMGDLPSAKQELLSLLSEDTRDTNLLQQVAKLCQANGEMDAAVGYQRKLVEIAPGHETEFPLATMLMANGNSEEAAEIMVRLTQREEDPARLVKSLDALMAQERSEVVLQIVGEKLGQQRDDWELLYREGVARMNLEKYDEAKLSFEQLLTLKLPIDALSHSEEARFKQAQNKAKSDEAKGLTVRKLERPGPFDIANQSNEVRNVIFPNSDQYYMSSASPVRSLWGPNNFGLARMAAMGWLMRREQLTNTAKSMAANEEDGLTEIERQVRDAASKTDASMSSLYDWYFFANLLDKQDELRKLTRRFAETGGKRERDAYMSSLYNRIQSKQVRQQQNQVAVEPMNEAELAFVLKCYEASKKENKNGEEAPAGNVIVSGGRVYVRVGNSYRIVGSGNANYVGVVANELRLAGKADQATELIKKEIENSTTTAQIGGALSLCLDETFIDLVPGKFDQWYAAALKDIKARPVVAGNTMNRATSNSPGMSLSVVSDTVNRWLGLLGKDEENQKILDVLNKYLDVAREEVKYEIAADALKKSKPNYIETSLQANWYFGDQSQYFQATAPLGMSPVEMQKMYMVRTVYEILNRNGVVEDLIPAIKKRVESSSGQDRVIEQMSLASVMWWGEEKEDAVELILAAVDQLPSREQIAIQVAQLLASVSENDRALEYLDKVNARDQRTMLQREMLALNIAERAGDVDRAQKAAERLFGLRLNTQQQSELLISLQRLGRSDLSNAILARAERTTGNQLNSLGSLMSLYASQGRTEEANQIALQILQRTASPMASSSTLMRSSRSYSSGNEGGERQRAILTLQQNRQLDSVIQKLEKQLSENPESQKLYEQLAELYETSGKSDKAIELIKKFTELRPKLVTWKYKLAQMYRQSGKMDEACTLYLDIIRLSPSMLNNEFYELRSLFRGTKRTGELTKALLSADFQGLRQYYYIVDLANEILREEPTSNEAIELIEKCLREYKQQKDYILGYVQSSEAWKNDKFFDIAITSLIPTPTQAKLDPWFGLKQIRSYSSGGRVNSTISTVLTTLAGTDKLPKLQKKIDEVVAAAPQWSAGKFITAISAIKNGREPEGIAQIKELMKDQSTVQSMTPTTCWIVGQDIIKYPELREQARSLLEKAKEDQTMRSNGIEYSPIILLVETYQGENDREKARDLLLGFTKRDTTNQYNDRDYDNYRYMESLIFIANQMNRLGFAEDTAAVCMDALMQKDVMTTASQYSGRSTSYANQFQALFNTALDSLSSQDPKIVVSRLVGGGATKSPVFNLILSAKTDQIVESEATSNRRVVPTNQPQELQNEFLEFVRSLYGKPGFGPVIKERILELQKQFPDDLSVVIVDAYIDTLQGGDAAKASTQRVVDYLSTHPLEPLAEGRRANNRQRKEASGRMVVWLLAKSLMGTAQWDSQGEVLAKNALDAAKRQAGYSETEVISNEWASLAVKAGNKADAEKLWRDLLAAATVRPVSKSANAPNGQANRVPPLTQSQFKIVTELAHNAAKNGLSGLSIEAMRESLKGGMPVADVAPANANPRTIMAMSASGAVMPGGVPGAPQAFNEQAAVQVMKVLKSWDKTSYDVQETLDLLRSFVFPATLKNEIYLYGVNSSLADGRSESLGRMLMDWAAAAGKSDEVLKQAEERAKSPDTKLCYMALKTFNALNAKNLPEAKANLEQIIQTLAVSNTEAATNTALHAALPAIDAPELRSEAYKILETAILFRLKQMSMNNRSSEAPKDELTSMYQKYLMENSSPEKIKEYFENRLLVSQQYANRYSGEYAIYLQKVNLANAAVELANAGRLEMALDYLGRSANIILVERYSDQSNAAFSVILQTRKLPIDQQFQLWKDWTMPTDQRQSMRFTPAQVQPLRTPKAFQREDWKHEELNRSSIWSNFHELVKAAKATSKLEEVKQLADKSVAEGQNVAKVLSLLCAIEMQQPDLDQQLTTYFEDTYKAPKETNNRRQQVDGNGFGSVLFEALRKTDYFASSIDRAEKYDQYERNRGTISYRSQVQLEFLDSLSAKANKKYQSSERNLAHWVTALLTPPSIPNQPAWWFGEGDNLRVFGGGLTTEALIYAYPIGGEFEFVADCFEGGWGECDIGFNGVMPRPLFYLNPFPIETLSQQNRLERKSALKSSRPGYDQQKVVSDGKTVKFYFNNYLFYQEPISTSSPWITLQTIGYNFSNYRNMRFTKKPTILKEVNLIGEKALDGWSASMFGESLPSERLRNEKVDDRNSYAYYQQSQLANGTDYYVRKDEMVSEAKDGMDKQQGWIYYQRAMQPKETFAYEFFYEGGKFQAWPTFGPLVLLLDNKEIRSHWISNNATLDHAEYDFSVIEKGFQKTGSVSLKNQDWNKLELSKDDQNIQVKLNGELVFERPFNDIYDHRFGIFHYRNHGLRVRNAKLTGNWPAQMSDELSTNLVAVTSPMSNDEKFILDALPPSTMYEPIAKDVVKQAREMGDEKAYSMLAGWVIPDEDQARFKMQFQLMPLEDQAKLASESVELERILSPAMELVWVAKRLNKLDELAQRVNAAQTLGSRDVRAKAAMLAMINVEQNKFAEARVHIHKLLEIAQEPLPKEFSDGDRAAELYVIYLAGRKPELFDDAWTLATKLRETERKEETKANEGNWRAVLHGAMGAITRWENKRNGGSEVALKQWTSVPSTTARQGAEGLRPSVWRKDKGILKHDAGESWSHLFFQSPLRGKYEITAKRSTFDYAEVLIATGMYSAEPTHDLKSRRLNRLLFWSQPVGGEIQIPNWDHTAEFRMVVDGNKVTTYTNGVEVHQQQFNGPLDPWIVLQQDNPWYFGTVENLQIKGTPEILSEIDLMDLGHCGGWISNFYNEGAHYGNPGHPYQFDGRQVTGTISTDTSSEYVESLLRYYRPMLEDGEIEFEFFYEPGKFELHPVIGRNAFLLGAGEVALHTMTDGPWDRAGRTSTASQPLPGAKNPGLKAKDWNHVLLKLVGDQAQLSVNGQQVAQLTVSEPANQRFFGVFRYKDKHEMKIRAVKYRGEWPKQLPAVENQELAGQR